MARFIATTRIQNCITSLYEFRLAGPPTPQFLSLRLMTSGVQKIGGGSDGESLQVQIISLKDWWSQGQKNDEFLPILDLRPPERFQMRRLSHDKLHVVHFPPLELKQRSFELPARHAEFSIIVSPQDLDLVESFLVKKESRKQRPTRPWKVANVLLDDEKLWEDAKDLAVYAESPPSDYVPFPRMWQPDLMVESVLLPLLKSRPSEGLLQVWDLASGAGRDVAFLAEELLACGNPYQVSALDHRYNEEKRSETEGFFERRGVKDVTRCIKLDLSSWGNVTEPTDSLAGLFCVRYWNLKLVSEISQSPRLKSGTLFGISHFCKPYEGAPWNFDHPSEKTVLERAQLNDLFSQAEWGIIHDEIALDSDHGRTMIHFVAKKR